MNRPAAAFGKMPALGDFFRIRAETAFVTVWDTWLQEIMVAGRSHLGASWDACYMQAPLWRFSLPAGMAGADPIIGVLMPSVDRVGRQFPLTLAVTTEDGGSPFRAYFANADTLDALETLALDALGDDMTRETLDARLSAISGRSVPPRGQSRRAPAGGMILLDADPAMEAADLAEAVLSPGTSSVWACRMQHGNRWMTLPDLPRGGDGIALFDVLATATSEQVA